MPSYQIKSHSKRLEVQTDPRKTVEGRLLDSLVDLSKGHVFLTGREPRCRNRLKSRKRAAAIAQAVCLNIFAVRPSGLKLNLPTN